MSIPTQRSDEAPSGAVMGIVIESLRRVEDSLTRLSENVTTQLARLPSDYVPRREVERRLDELTLDIGAERTERMAALKEIRTEADIAKERASQFRRYLIATGVAAIGAVGGVGVGVINHFS